MATTNQKLTCSKCGRVRKETEFFLMKSGNRHDICKDCLCQYIDNSDPDTFCWILELFDVPYIEKEWIKLARHVKEKTGKLTSKSVLGRYIRMMNMNQWKDYRYADSDRLNFENNKAQQEALAAQEQMSQKEEFLKEQLEKGEISQAEYNTLSSSTAAAAKQEFNPDLDSLKPDTSPDDAVLQELTEEDMQYLKLKWGHMYRPSQWVTMETMYQKYANEYEMNVDREEILKKMCKTSLKMDDCLDAGDVASYQKLSTVFEAQRKSGKFTEAQNKEKEERYLDTIGELVRLCEEAKGPIANNLPDPDEYPQDKIDFTIKDLKAYTYSLVAGEPHMQDLIETFIEKYEKAEAAETDIMEENFVLSDEDAMKDMLTDEEAMEYQDFLEEEIAADAEALLAELEGDKNVS